jgi:hypothetical protein
MTDAQKAALAALKASIEGKPAPSTGIDPETGKPTTSTPLAANLLGDVLAVAELVKDEDQTTKDLRDACLDVRDMRGSQAAETVVFQRADQIKHLIEKAEGKAEKKADKKGEGA